MLQCWMRCVQRHGNVYESKDVLILRMIYEYKIVIYFMDLKLQ